MGTHVPLGDNPISSLELALPPLRRPQQQLRRPPTKLRGAPIGPAEVEAAVDAAVKAALATSTQSRKRMASGTEPDAISLRDVDLEPDSAF